MSEAVTQNGVFTIKDADVFIWVQRPSSICPLASLGFASRCGFLDHCHRFEWRVPLQPDLNLGVFSPARFDDSRTNLIPGPPECREHTFQCVDSDEQVGKVSEVFRVIASGLLAT